MSSIPMAPIRVRMILLTKDRPNLTKRRTTACNPAGKFLLRNYELVSHAVHGDQPPWRRRIVFELRSEQGDVHIDRARVGITFIAPHAIQQVVARYDFAGLRSKQPQDAEFLPC